MNRHAKKFGARLRPDFRDPTWPRPVFVGSFACFAGSCVRESPVAARGLPAPLPPNVVNVHRYEERIAGRTYHIEVRLISETRWRAQIARLPGLPSSMMPFYGPTPEEAARELSRWLALVYNGTTRQ